MKPRSFKIYLIAFVVIFSSLLIYSSTSMNDYIIVETKDMDSDTTTNWMRLHIKLTNTGPYMIDLKNIELQYFYTDNNSNLVDSNSTPVWWFNAHSPDWQYNFGTQEDVEIFITSANK